MRLEKYVAMSNYLVINQSYLKALRIRYVMGCYEIRIP